MQCSNQSEQHLVRDYPSKGIITVLHSLNGPRIQSSLALLNIVCGIFSSVYRLKEGCEFRVLAITLSTRLPGLLLRTRSITANHLEAYKYVSIAKLVRLVQTHE